MLILDQQTICALEALARHPSAWFKVDDLYAFLAHNPQIVPMDYAATVKLQLDVIAALSGFLAARESQGRKNIMEGLALGSATMGLALTKLTESHPMPNEDIAVSLASACANMFHQNVGVQWKPPQWVKQPTIEPPHSSN